VRTIHLGVLDQRLPNAPTKRHAKRRTNPDRLWRQQLGVQHLGIPPWLIPYIDYEVKELLRGNGDIDRVLEGCHLE
jgi:hypothetical protein